MTDQDQSRADFKKWAEREYRNADEYSRRDFTLGLAAWQAALNHKAADVVLPEAQCEIDVRTHATYVGHEIYEWRDNLPDGTYKLYTEQQVRELLAAAPSLPQGWMPIESAPDYTTILVLGTCGIVVAYKESCGDWKADGVDTTYDMAYTVLQIGKLTHWMPLPQPPKMQGS